MANDDHDDDDDIYNGYGDDSLPRAYVRTFIHKSGSVP